MKRSFFLVIPTIFKSPVLLQCGFRELPHQLCCVLASDLSRAPAALADYLAAAKDH